MLTCNLPYDAPDARALLRAKVRGAPKSPRDFARDIDPALEAIILKAIAPSPRDRYPDPAAMLYDLRNPSEVQTREVEDDTPRTTRRRARVPRKLALSLASAAVLASLGSLVWLTDHYSAGTRPPIVVARQG